MELLEQLKEMVDEENYPYFEDAFLREKLRQTTGVYPLISLARDLCLVKAGIEEMKLGDITIPSPKHHFLTLASQYRISQTGAVGRADEYTIL